VACSAAAIEFGLASWQGWVLLVAKEEQSQTYSKTVLKGQAAKGIGFKAKAWTMHAMQHGKFASRLYT
jgi:hypothetical protein